MIYAKHSGFVRMSLAFVALVLVAWSTTSVLYAFQFQLGTECPAPCKNSFGGLLQCVHEIGESDECETDFCIEKEMRMINCTECPNPGPNAVGCYYNFDFSEWFRFTWIIDNTCLIFGEWHLWWGECMVGYPEAGSMTPCGTIACDGPIFSFYSDKPRAVCSPPPSP